MKLIIVDYRSYIGHRIFNKIHIEALLDLGHTIHLIGRKEAFSFIEKPTNLSFTQLPPKYDSLYNQHFITRQLKDTLFLCWLGRLLKAEVYDAVIFITYGIKSLFFYRSKKRIILVNHDNVSILGSIDKLLMRLLPRNYEHVVLTTDARQFLQGIIPNVRITYIPHGFLEIEGNVKKPPYIRTDAKFLFCPVNSDYDDNLLHVVLDSDVLHEYIRSKNIYIVIKSKVYNHPSNHIICVDNKIPDEEYRYLIMNSIAVVLPYNKDYQYRTSGILFEALGARTAVIASKIDSMMYYQDMMNIRFFDDTKSFVQALDCLSTNNINYDLSIFSPKTYWNALLSNF